MAKPMQLAPRSAAVESFLRNFERERMREVLEVALCYGVFCLAQNFSLKGVSVEELRAVTSTAQLCQNASRSSRTHCSCFGSFDCDLEYDTIKKRDFFVRNVGISLRRGGHSDAALMRADDVTPLHVKPSHSWRDGDDKTATQVLDESENRGVKMLPSSTQLVSLETPEVAAEGKPFDAIDFYTTLFGKAFVDTAWTAFTARNGSQIASKDALHDRFTRIDQRKSVAKFPLLELPVSSFVEFLSEYVKLCVGRTNANGADAASDDMESDDEMLPRDKENVHVNVSSRPRQRDVPGAVENTQTLVRKSTVMGPGKPQRARQPSPHVSPQSASRPRSLQHVQSKVKPELDARRDKMLRVKKTQTQLMKESLARTRLAEYEAKKLLDEATAGKSNAASFQRSARKMPLSGVTMGAAALEIADSFMNSPLLDTFSRRDAKDGSTASRVNATTATAARDPLRDELYGTTPLDDAFLGCRPSPVPAPRKPPTRRESNRAYNGWLGDFGPLHTKTVLPEWTPGDEDDGSDEGGAERHQTLRWHDRGASTPSKKFEWNFDGIDAGSRKQQRRPFADHFGRSKQSEGGRSSVFGPEDREIDTVSDDYLSDDLRSEVSDPVFKWLKQAV